MKLMYTEIYISNKLFTALKQRKCRPSNTGTRVWIDMYPVTVLALCIVIGAACMFNVHQK